MKPVAALSFLCLLATATLAQDRLPTMPRYDRYSTLRGEIAGSVRRASIDATWSADGKAFSFTEGGQSMVFDIATLKKAPGVAFSSPTATRPADPNRGRPRPERGRQFEWTFSADGKLKAFYKDRNVWISSADGSNAKQITTYGDASKRTKAGQASWVYGEELGVNEAMWWAPDGKRLAYYRFDDSEVKDYYLAMNVVKVQNTLDVEAYPKAGAPNPKVELWMYDVATDKHTKLDVTFGDASLGYYVFAVRWSPNGEELHFYRSNRKQNTMDFCAANPSTGACRRIVQESHPNSWTDVSPFYRALENQTSFLWASERNGYRNLYLGTYSGGVKPITNHNFDVENVLRVDETTKTLYYTARDGENPHRLQAHRIKFDGSDHRRMTDPAFHHSVNLSPTGKHYIDTAETIGTAPVVRLCDDKGTVLATLAASDTTKFEQLKIQPVERFKFKAADGLTDCYGTLMKPSDFDPSRKYPVLVSCYAGPESGGSPDRFQLPSAITEMGFLVVWIDGRGTSGRGKAFKDAVYGKLGVVEIDDQAAGVKELAKRSYVDGTRVGIFGTSYGGYTAAMAILRHPDVFHAAVACSPVTDWRNYDTIYTERYMGLPWDNENKAGYDAGSAMTYASALKGRLLLYYGTADNNVHPANSYQLANALQAARKSFYMMAGPDEGHTAVDGNYQWEFFMDHLVLARR